MISIIELEGRTFLKVEKLPRGFLKNYQDENHTFNVRESVSVNSCQFIFNELLPLKFSIVVVASDEMIFSVPKTFSKEVLEKFIKTLDF
jgi:hypothetical protein